MKRTPMPRVTFGYSLELKAPGEVPADKALTFDEAVEVVKQRRATRRRALGGKRTGHNGAHNRRMARLRPLVWERDQACCVVCGGALDPDHWEAHHRRFLSRGGKDTIENLIAVHPLCHRLRIHLDMSGEAKANGWAVASTDDPAQVPCLFFNGGFVLLTETEEAA